MRDSIDRWQGEGVNVVIFGRGNADFAEACRAEFELDAMLLVDPDLAAYRAAGLRRGRLEIASPKFFRYAYRDYREGARQSGVEGDPWQLSGAFVFDRGGDLELALLSREGGGLQPERVKSEEGREITFATHLAGSHRLTRGLREALEANGGGGVIGVSSGGMLTRRLNVDDAQWRERPYDEADSSSIGCRFERIGFRGRVKTKLTGIHSGRYVTMRDRCAKPA